MAARRQRRRGKPDPDKIIHVVFGPGGGRVTPEPPAKKEAVSNGISEPSDPTADQFTRAEVSRLLGLTPSRLQNLDKSGVVSPTGKLRGRRAYTFSDLIQLKTAQGLLSNKVRLRDVIRATQALKKTLPKVARPLAELRIQSDGKKVIVHTEDGRYEPETGQLLLDLEVKELREDVVRVLRPNAGRERARTAYELYLKASQLDEDPNTMDEAEALYAQAIEHDPWLAIAYTNLGNIRYRRNDQEAAEGLYGRALSIDNRQPEARYNLGYLMLERGDADSAIPLFEGAIDADPKFADAHFNLAMALEQIGESTRARPYWEEYISLEPSGTWTEIAKRHL